GNSRATLVHHSDYDWLILNLRIDPRQDGASCNFRNSLTCGYGSRLKAGTTAESLARPPDHKRDVVPANGSAQRPAR
ncbi:hypothetical protein, partial [Bradyrhizobium sp.]|uniref:hypothetical protein n=1 Tax=Bradyrhizobium sp. TaxID=376 RepID=UPI003C3BAB01